MLMVIGHVVAPAARREEMLALAAEHSVRSRAEPGCLAHACHVEVEDPARIVFVEQWADAAALRAHFAKPESAAFAKAMRDMSQVSPVMKLFQADELAISQLG